MRFYPVPIEVEEEKTFGGYLTIRQVVYIVATVILMVSCFFVLLALGVNIVLIVLLCACLMMAGAAFAFYNVDEMSFDRQIFYLVRYYTRTRSFPLRGDAE